MFCKGGPGKNHQARLPGALVGLEGLSFILSCTEPWNTVFTHAVSNFSSWGVPMERFNSSPVPPNIRPRNTSPYTASIKGRLHTRFGSAESWSNILCLNIRCVSSRYNTFPPLQRRESYLLLRGILCRHPFIGASPSPTPSPSPSPSPPPFPSPSVTHLLLPRCVSKEFCVYCAGPEKSRALH